MKRASMNGAPQLRKFSYVINWSSAFSSDQVYVLLFKVQVKVVRHASLTISLYEGLSNRSITFV